MVRLSLSGAFSYGHGALYAPVNRRGSTQTRCAGPSPPTPVPRFVGGQILLATDVSNWLRPEATTSPERLFCHTYARGKDRSQMIPGWPCSFVAALGRGDDLWTGPLDARRVGPDDDETAVTATQLRGVVARLRGCGARAESDPDILSLHDAGYNLTTKVRRTGQGAQIGGARPCYQESTQWVQERSSTNQTTASRDWRRHAGHVL